MQNKYFTVEWASLRRSIPLSLRSYDTFLTLQKGNQRIIPTYLSEKKLNRPILFKNYRVTFILTATI